MTKTKKTAITIIFMVISLVGFSQTYDGDLALTTQAEVDAFNYSEITGNLTIEEQSDGIIDNLNNLNTLTLIGGNLTIQNNSNLKYLIGLENLTTINGFLSIEKNGLLESLSELQKITSVKGLSIIQLYSLNSLAGLNNLITISRFIQIKHNSSLTTIEALRNVVTNNDFQSISIYNNTSLLSLDGLNNIKTTTSSIEIESNHKLKSIRGLNNINSIGRSLRIGYNYELTSLEGLEKLIEVGSITIIANKKITSLKGLENVISLGSKLYIGRVSFSSGAGYGNDLLSDFCGISQLLINGEIIESEYYVANNATNPTYQEVKTNCNNNSSPPILTLIKEDFGDVDLGSQTTKNIAVRNTGESTLTLASITKTDTNGNFVLLGNDSNISLEPNETFNFLVRLNANSLGAKEMTLHIDSNASTTTEDFVITGNVNAPETLGAIKPETPTAVAVDEQAIKISWQENINALSYRLYRNTSYDTKEQIYWGNATTFCDTKLNAETSYSYSIVVENASGLSLFSEEVSETTKVEPIGVTRPVADLTPVLLGIEETYQRWIEDDYIEVNLGVYNKGNAISEEVYASLSLSQTNKSGANEYVLLDNILIDKIEPSKIYTTTKYIRIPEVITGDYHLVFKIDINNSLDDKDTYNNVKVSNKSFTIYPKSAGIKPDLVSNFISFPNSIVKGVEGEIEILTRNVGNQSATGFSGKLYLSKDRYFSFQDDIKISDYFHDYLDVDTNKKDIRKYTIPTTVDSGNYYLIYETDSSEEIDELYEQNNFVSSSEKVEVLASNGIVEISGKVNIVNSLYNNNLSLKGIIIDGLPGIVKTKSNGTFSAPVEIGGNYKLSIKNPLYLVAPVIEGSDIIT